MTARVVDRNNKDPSVFALAINELASGRSNATGSVTLTVSAGSTTVSNANFATTSHVAFTPLTSNAAAEWKNGTMYVSARSKGSFTITHANNSQSDRSFTYGIQG